MKKIINIYLLIVMCGGLLACSTTEIQKRPVTKAMIEQRSSLLTTTRLSSDSQSRLVQAGIDIDKCLQNMSNCIVYLHNASLVDNKGLFGTFSELFYVSAQRRKLSVNCQTQPQDISTEFAKQHQPNYVQKPIDLSCYQAYQDDLLQTIRFAYIYLVYDILQPNHQHQTLYQLPKEQDIHIQALYKLAIDELGDKLYEDKIMNEYHVHDNKITVTLNEQAFDNRLTGMKLLSNHQINLNRLHTISRRDGIGVNYVAVLDDRYITSVANQIQNYRDDIPIKQRIHALGYLPKTLLLRPQGNTLDELMSTHQFSLAIYDPYQVKNVLLMDKSFALSANFSAPYGLWLKENSLDFVSIFNMLSKNYQNGQPHLFMLEPYQPNKRVIIMIHGLASSPETWIQLTNDIFNDETLRENYQVWQIFYPTNMPILENRYQIQQLITTAFQQLDPKAQHKASSHAVIIGHSMGGIIGRLLVSNDDLTPKLKDLFLEYNKKFNIDFNQKKYHTLAHNPELMHRFSMRALPQVDRAVFISAPFRGTDFADKWFTRTLRRMISLPTGSVKMLNNELNYLFTEGQLVGNPLRELFLENGASQLSDKSLFMKLTKDVDIAKTVKVHTVIATDDKDLLNYQIDLQENMDKVTSQETQPISRQLYSLENLIQAHESVLEKNQLLQNLSQDKTEHLSDGIVPYQSARLDNVESQTILLGKHNVHTSPQAVLALRKILHTQLENQQ